MSDLKNPIFGDLTKIFKTIVYKNNISEKELMKLLGLGQQQVNRLINCRSHITDAHLQPLLDKYGYRIVIYKKIVSTRRRK